MQHTIENGRLCATINSLGAELCSLLHQPSGQEVIWQGDPSLWMGHSPLLFPVVGKLRDDRYFLGATSYPMPKHGFASISSFSLMEQSPSSLTLSLTDSKATRESYPFAFQLSLTFALRENRLEIIHAVHNPSLTDVLPFSIGAHPAFRCALGDILLFEKQEEPVAYQLGPDLLLDPVPRPIPLRESRLRITASLFAQDALILQEPHSHFLTLERGEKSGIPHVRVDWFDAPVLGLWAKPGAPYVCVEPWHGIDDTPAATGQLTEKSRIILLPPKETFHFPVHITLLEGTIT